MVASSLDASVIFAFALRGSLLAALAVALLAHIQERRRMRAAEAAEMIRLQQEVERLTGDRNAVRRAEAAMDSKTKAMATMSHELRTPLSGILGVVDILDETPLNREQQSFLGAIRGSGVSLMRLIDDMLDLSKIEAGRAQLAVAPLDLSKLVEGVVELLAPRAQSKGLEIAASVASGAPARVIGDEPRLRQILVNLAGNAVKFTDRGGVGVSVDCAADGGLVFSITDTGPGVPVERREAIFEDFEQDLGAGAREGAGLGLAICKRLAALMGGAITLADNPRGGSIFRFTVALPPAEPEAGAASSAAADQSFAGSDVCIVAHSPFEAPFMAARLAEAGARVRRAEGLEEGLAMLKSGQPRGLVIVDCALGEAAMEALAAAAKTAGARQCLVLFSPFERRGIPGPSLNAFDGWLVKPVRASSLFERLQPGEKAARLPPQRERAPRALLAEDDDVNALITERALRRLGYDVARARDGLAALQLARAAISESGEAIDLVVMDLRMPGMSGEDATRVIRRLEKEHGRGRLPIIALSASFDEFAPAEAGAGIDAFLPKPAEVSALAAAIERLETPRKGGVPVARKI